MSSRSSKLFLGIGAMDVVNGSNCPEYFKWRNMLSRCYDPLLQEINTSYIGCSVIEEWWSFRNFREWLHMFPNVRLDIDKDILKKGNSVYCPEYCRLVPRYINTLFTYNVARELPLGVTYIKKQHTLRKPFLANRARVFGKNHYLGYFSTALEAHAAWQLSKVRCISSTLERYSSDVYFLKEIYDSIEQRMTLIQQDIDNGRETTFP